MGMLMFGKKEALYLWELLQGKKDSGGFVDHEEATGSGEFSHSFG